MGVSGTERASASPTHERAQYLIIAWRVLLLTTIGRECPDWPCAGVFETKEWQAAYTVAKKAPPPKTPPSLADRARIAAGLFETAS